jgi:hypothetical protein|nr:MAG TPA: collagen alpha 1(VIII) chain protein [Caudoviricetes sp.]
MADNTLTLKIDNETVLPLLAKIGKDIILPIIEGAGKSAYAIAVAHGYKGTEQEWLDSLRGPQGATGPTGPQGIQGPAGPKGPKGEAGSAVKAAELLKSKNIYLENSDVDTVISKLIKKLSDDGYLQDASFKQLEYIQPHEGQEYIDLTGEPHFKVAVNGGEKREFESDNMRVSIEPFGAKNIELKYYDLNDNEQQTLIIRSIIAKPDDAFTSTNGISYKKFGNELEIDVSNYDSLTPIKFLPKWSMNNITKFILKSRKKVMLKLSKESIYDTAAGTFAYDMPISVDDYNLISFEIVESIEQTIALKGKGHSEEIISLSQSGKYLVWNQEEQKYQHSDTETL